MLDIDFIPDYQRRLLTQEFKVSSTLAASADVKAWQKQWMAQLSSWHTPYKSLVDCQQLCISDNEEVQTALATMLAFFQKLFLHKIAGYNCNKDKNHHLLPFPQYTTQAEAEKAIGIRGTRVSISKDLRSQVILLNHFRQQVVELSFSQQYHLDSDEKLNILQSKLANNLTQWHTKWSLLVDCANFSLEPTFIDAFQKMTAFLQRYFLQSVVGYNNKQSADSFPFRVFRAKHRAALEIESGDVAGDEAHCRSSSKIG